jgi:GNAT superfamily N-acetyltransferase
MTDKPAIVRLESDEEILATAAVMRQLRPHIQFERYLSIVRRMMGSDGYRLVAVSDAGTVRAVAGYRIIEMLYCGRLLSVDDLVTDETTRSRGHGKLLLSWLQVEGRRLECTELHLDSGTQRERAHRFYFREGLTVTAFHFRTKL